MQTLIAAQSFMNIASVRYEQYEIDSSTPNGAEYVARLADMYAYTTARFAPFIQRLSVLMREAHLPRKEGETIESCRAEMHLIMQVMRQLNIVHNELPKLVEQIALRDQSEPYESVTIHQMRHFFPNIPNRNISSNGQRTEIAEDTQVMTDGMFPPEILGRWASMEHNRYILTALDEIGIIIKPLSSNIERFFIGHMLHRLPLYLIRQFVLNGNMDLIERVGIPIAKEISNCSTGTREGRFDAFINAFMVSFKCVFASNTFTVQWKHYFGEWPVENAYKLVESFVRAFFKDMPSANTMEAGSFVPYIHRTWKSIVESQLETWSKHWQNKGKSIIPLIISFIQIKLENLEIPSSIAALASDIFMKRMLFEDPEIVGNQHVAVDDVVPMDDDFDLDAFDLDALADTVLQELEAEEKKDHPK